MVILGEIFGYGIVTSKDIFYVVIANNLKFKYVLMDIWFASTENSEYIANKNKEFIVAII